MANIKSTIEKAFGNKLRLRVSGIIIRENQILLVKQNAINDSGFIWLPPGGGLSFGESIEACLQREVLEETGFEIIPSLFFNVTEYLEIPLHAVELFYEAKIIGGTLKTGIDPELPEKEQLISHCQWLTITELENIPKAQKHKILQDIERLKKLIN